MKLLLFFTLLYSSTVMALGSGLDTREPKCPKKEGYKDHQTIEKFKATGQCFKYRGAGNDEKSFAPCSGPDGYCQKVKGFKTERAGCQLVIPEGVDIDPSLISTDEDCNEWIAGECVCDCEFCEDVFMAIAKGLQKLDNVICAVMLSSFATIADIGLLFVPGGQASVAVKAAVQGAKSFYQNGEEAASFFGGWIGPACGIPDFDFDVTKVFGSLIEAPDSMSRGKPVGCKKKSGCRDVKSVPDPTKKPEKPTARPTDKPKPKSTPTRTTPSSTSSRTTTTATAGAGCAYCGEFGKTKAARDDKYQFMYARAGKSADAPVCIKPPPDSRVNKRSLFSSLSDQLFPRSFFPQKRGLTEKDTEWDQPLGQTGKWKVTIFLGKYAGSGEAESIPEISKYWSYKIPANANQCSTEVVQARQKGGSDYDTDHVYEAQTFGRFIIWLADEDPNGVGTYRKPSAEWVVDTFLSAATSTNRFLLKKPGNTNVGDLNTPSFGEAMGALLAYGFGRSDGVKGETSTGPSRTIERIPAARGNKNLALLNKEINNAKGKWFKLQKPASSFGDYKTQLDFRLKVRTAVGPWQFLAAREGRTDTIWKKWARVSNWFDLVLHEFDQQYQWGSNTGEPLNTKPGSKTSIRAMYAYWIDKHLEEIEVKSKTWANEAKTAFDRKFPMKTLSRDEKEWRQDAFGPNGFATPKNMRFPRPTNLKRGASPYGATAWTAVTFDASNKNPDIGLPESVY